MKQVLKHFQIEDKETMYCVYKCKLAIRQREICLDAFSHFTLNNPLKLIVGRSVVSWPDLNMKQRYFFFFFFRMTFYCVFALTYFGYIDFVSISKLLGRNIQNFKGQRKEFLAKRYQFALYSPPICDSAIRNWAQYINRLNLRN